MRRSLSSLLASLIGSSLALAVILGAASPSWA
jgi:hypothetical protein